MIRIPNLRTLFHQSSSPAAIQPVPYIKYSWILSRRLAIGPMPLTHQHWQQLDDVGFRGRFSCCYETEEACPPPEHWNNKNVSLPDHRRQEPMSATRLCEALDSAISLLAETDGSPVFLHCYASKERSPLLAVGITAIMKQTNVFEALEWVRRCHPIANPLYEHLDILESVINSHE